MEEAVNPYNNPEDKPEDDLMGQAIWSPRGWRFRAVTPGITPLRGVYSTLLQARAAATTYMRYVLAIELAISTALADAAVDAVASARRRLGETQSNNRETFAGRSTPPTCGNNYIMFSPGRSQRPCARRRCARIKAPVTFKR